MNREDVPVDCIRVDGRAAEAARPQLRHLGRQLRAGVVHHVLPRRPGALTAVPVEVGLCAVGQVGVPGSGEVGPRLLESRGGAVRPQATVDRREEAAAPAPLIDVDRDPGALGDRADLHVAIEDVPAFLMAVLCAASGERGHGLLNRGQPGIGKPLRVALRGVPATKGAFARSGAPRAVLIVISPTARRRL